MTMEHFVRFECGHDCIKFECINDDEHCKPSGGGSHGWHGLSLRFVSKGQEGAVQFLLFTDWTPQAVSVNETGVRYISDWAKGTGPVPADLGFHSKTPRYDGQKASHEHCEFCDGLPCYVDGSGLNANDAMYALVNGGDEALWTFLDAYYERVFRGAPYPEPAEYPKGTRR